MREDKTDKKKWLKPTIKSLKFNQTKGGLVAGEYEDNYTSPGPIS